MKYFSFLVFFFLTISLSAQVISGVTKDSITGETLPFVNIYIPGTSLGTFSDENGDFSFKVPRGINEYHFSILSYKEVILNLNIKKDTFIMVSMNPTALMIGAVLVEAKRSKYGNQIIRKLIENADKVITEKSTFSSNNYIKTHMEVWKDASTEEDSVQWDAGYETAYLKEIASRQHFDNGKYKAEILGELINTKDSDLKKRSRMAVSSAVRGGDQWIEYNPIDFFKTSREANIELYDNQINCIAITDRPISSPISAGAFINYRFRLKEITLRGEDSIFRISVEPIFSQAPLFEGELIVNGKDWVVEHAELSLKNSAVTGFKDFKFVSDYSKVGDNLWKVTERNFYYKASLSKKDYTVNTVIIDSDFDLNPEFPSGFFGREIVKYSEEALTRDTSLWVRLRPSDIQVSKNEREFIVKQDSIWNYENSEEYFLAQDSNYNKVTVLNVLWSGVNYRNRGRGISFGFNSLAASIRPLGVGGYRQSLGGWVTKEFPNNNDLRVRYDLDYGFNNNDLKGRLRVGYTYLPQRFARAFVSVGDTYDLITIYESLDNILSRGNYVRNQQFGVGHVMEVVNGLYATIELAYADKRSIEGLQLEEWSGFLFGDNNTPQPFERYKSFIFSANFEYMFGQQYITRGRKKIVLGNSYPTLRMTYKKGIPGIFSSEVNFDHLEVQLFQEMPVTKLGNSNWSILAGRYLNQESLRFIEYKYFRGSTPLIFSNPMRDHQLLGPTLSTSNTYLQAMFIHHFNGFIMDKIPGINWLQLEVIAGGGALGIPDQNFYHLEAFAGIGKKFKFRGETLQVAVYGTTSDNTVDKWAISYKIGVNFFNAFTGKWIY